jgi:perosamine synthetase
MIPITAVDVIDAEPYVLDVLRSGIIAQGPMVRRFEESFAKATGAHHVIAVNNGTTALVAALDVLDLQPGDEVITSPFTFVATLNAIIHTGAVARFADISETDFCLTPESVRTVLGPRTKVLLPVHLYGQMADMGALAPLAMANDLTVVEDAAQAVGATFDGRPAGSFGLGCFSLYATKNITTAEGGVITTADPVLAERLRILRNQGMRAPYRYDFPGHNYRMTDLHAAVGVPQLARLNELIEARRRNAESLNKYLADIPGLVTPSVAAGRTHVWHQYTVRVTEDAAVTRDELAAGLAARGIGTGVYYPRVVFDYDCFRDHPNVIAAEVPVASKVAGQVLSLPVHPKLTESDVDRIAEAVREVLR